MATMNKDRLMGTEGRLETVEGIIGISFKEKRLLELALRQHIKSRRDLVYVYSFTTPDNSSVQRAISVRFLQTFGDAVLRFLAYDDSVRLSSTVIRRPPEEITNKHLARIFDSFGLAQFLEVDNPNVEISLNDIGKGNVVEALLAAVYLDKGVDEARKFFLKIKTNLPMLHQPVS